MKPLSDHLALHQGPDLGLIARKSRGRLITSVEPEVSSDSVRNDLRVVKIKTWTNYTSVINKIVRFNLTNVAKVPPGCRVDELAEDGPVSVRACVPDPLPGEAPVLVAEERHEGGGGHGARPDVARQLRPRRVQPHKHSVRGAEAQACSLVIALIFKDNIATLRSHRCPRASWRAPLGCLGCPR